VLNRPSDEFWELCPRAIFACIEKHTEHVITLQRAESHRVAALCATVMNARTVFGKGRRKLYKTADFLPDERQERRAITAKQAMARMLEWGASIRASGK